MNQSFIEFASGVLLLALAFLLMCAGIYCLILIRRK